MKKFFNILLLIVFATSVSLLAQTTLTVTPGTATLDGVISPGEYTSTPLVTPTLGVTLNAMDDGQFFYLAATWADATESVTKKQWLYDGANWTQSGDEDRIAFMFDMGQNDPEGVNCVSMCHSPIMNTSVGKVDVWHWKSHRGNPMGFADDKYFNEVLGGDGGRHGDPGTSTYSNNGPDVSSLPEFMAITDPGANVDFLVNTASIGTFDPYGVISRPFAESTTFGAAFSNGNVIPGYLLRTGADDRGDVMAAGKWDSGVWTVEFKRKNSGSDNDFWVPSGGSVDFTHETFDNEGGSAAGHGVFDAIIYTLDFSLITDAEDADQLPQTYSLKQNYPNPFNPSTTIEYSLPEQSNVTIKIYDALGNELEVLFSGNKSAGTHRLNWDASNYASGIYFYKMNTGTFNQEKKMLLLK